MSIEVLKAGVLDTLQDDGRHGYGKWGINPGGVMDHYAAQVGNALVGNGADAAVLEMHFPASHLLFKEHALISITGADMSPSVNGVDVPLWKPLMIKAGSTLTFNRHKKGARSYLAVRGGLLVTPWLDSRSTNLKIGAGGLHGRALKKGDIIPIQSASFLQSIEGSVKVLPWSVNHAAVYGQDDDIYFTPGHEWHWLSESSQQAVAIQKFKVGTASDRMACHVSHDPLTFSTKQELLSSAVCRGTIQALPSGNLLILMADHQTTGGYPRVGHVATAHLPRLAQLSANDVFRLEKISVATAEKMLLSLGRDLQNTITACRNKLETYEATH